MAQGSFQESAGSDRTPCLLTDTGGQTAGGSRLGSFNACYEGIFIKNSSVTRSPRLLRRDVKSNNTPGSSPPRPFDHWGPRKTSSGRHQSQSHHAIRLKLSVYFLSGVQPVMDLSPGLGCRCRSEVVVYPRQDPGSPGRNGAGALPSSPCNQSDVLLTDALLTSEVLIKPDDLGFITPPHLFLRYTTASPQSRLDDAVTIKGSDTPLVFIARPCLFASSKRTALPFYLGWNSDACHICWIAVA
ncbi:hypothetical protein DPEC_G00083640 [Dallia pectoralis]|uniref:Uncharacterized protein n=1 Tax=Dallia pectoralis TaxID=75939 RepID=A0ACC2GZ56_DALPE|nr:hypothetical protein DPEC_G00083640 [Dallia pectoralis]